jgi:hypothetical protein
MVAPESTEPSPSTAEEGGAGEEAEAQGQASGGDAPDRATPPDAVPGGVPEYASGSTRAEKGAEINKGDPLMQRDPAVRDPALAEGAVGAEEPGVGKPSPVAAGTSVPGQAQPGIPPEGAGVGGPGMGPAARPGLGKVKPGMGDPGEPDTSDPDEQHEEAAATQIGTVGQPGTTQPVEEGPPATTQQRPERHVDGEEEDAAGDESARPSEGADGG